MQRRVSTVADIDNLEMIAEKKGYEKGYRDGERECQVNKVEYWRNKYIEVKKRLDRIEQGKIPSQSERRQDMAL